MPLFVYGELTIALNHTGESVASLGHNFVRHLLSNILQVVAETEISAALEQGKLVSCLLTTHPMSGIACQVSDA